MLLSKPSSKFPTPPSTSLFMQPNTSAFAPSLIAPIFQHIYLSLPQDQCDSYIERLEQFFHHHPQSLSPVPVLPPLTSRLYFPPPADTPLAVELDNNSNESYEQTIPISTDHPQTFTLDNGQNVLFFPFCVLPRPNQLHIPLTTPDTTCFQCHGNGHYREDCPDYICPHCRIANPGHPSCLCLTV